jgi:hypothetical protein
MGKRPPSRRSIKANRRNTMKISTRLGLAALTAVVAASLAMPSVSLANQNAQKSVKAVERTTPPFAGKKHPKLDLTVCDPGHKNFNMDKCLH